MLNLLIHVYLTEILNSMYQHPGIMNLRVVLFVYLKPWLNSSVQLLSHVRLFATP